MRIRQSVMRTAEQTYTLKLQLETLCFTQRDVCIRTYCKIYLIRKLLMSLRARRAIWRGFQGRKGRENGCHYVIISKKERKNESPIIPFKPGGPASLFFSAICQSRGRTLSTSSAPRLPKCCHASCHDGNVVNIWTVNHLQLNAFIYKCCPGHFASSQE